MNKTSQKRVKGGKDILLVRITLEKTDDTGNYSFLVVKLGKKPGTLLEFSLFGEKKFPSRQIQDSLRLSSDQRISQNWALINAAVEEIRLRFEEEEQKRRLK